MNYRIQIRAWKLCISRTFFTPTSTWSTSSNRERQKTMSEVRGRIFFSLWCGLETVSCWPDRKPNWIRKFLILVENVGEWGGGWSVGGWKQITKGYTTFHKFLHRWTIKVSNLRWLQDRNFLTVARFSVCFLLWNRGERTTMNRGAMRCFWESSLIWIKLISPLSPE